VAPERHVRHDSCNGTVLCTNTPTQLLPPRRRALEKLPVAQIVNKFLSFYGSRRFISVHKNPTLVHILTHEFTPSYPIYLRSILILSSNLRLRLPRRNLPSSFPIKILHTFLTSHVHTIHPILVHSIILTYKLRTSVRPPVLPVS
jgi:hypothetical protein